MLELLNQLDGFDARTDVKVILATNKIESLDPALIRPGRIDRQILLGHLRLPAAVEMVEHYFAAKLTAGQHAALAEIFAGFEKAQHQLSPAKMEQLCASYDTVEALMEGLRLA